MQIDKRASLDFQAKLLLGVLLLCLCAPFFWDPVDEKSPGGEEFFTVLMPGPRVVFPLSDAELSFSDRQSVLPLAGRWPAAERARYFDEQLLRIERPQSTISTAHVHDACHFAGKQFAKWLTSEALSARITLDDELKTLSHGGKKPMKSVLVRRPVDRLAMLPDRVPLGASARVPTWAVPTELLLRLEELGDRPQAAIWSLETASVVRQLTTAGHIKAADRAALMHRLEELSHDAVQLADSTSSETLASELRRAHYALQRRHTYWSLAVQIEPSAGLAYVAVRGDTLPNMAASPIDVRTLNSQLETYELIRSPELAQSIAEHRQRLALSSHEPHQRLAARIDENYRNANIRVAVSADLLERFLPKQEGPVGRPVQDRIAGAMVRGNSTVQQRLNLQLEPDPKSWHVTVASRGTIDSNTVSSDGPVRVRNQGTTAFQASKRIVAGTDGLRAKPAAVKAHHTSRLINIRSTLDGIPIFGSYARQRGREQYHRRHHRANSEVEFKTSARIQRQLDDSTDRLINDVNKRIESRMAPLRKTGITLDTIEMQTTDKRLIGRFRLATAEQLAAHTPRVRALSDSEASLQLHETALTNAAKSLELDGRRLTAPELAQLLIEKLPNSHIKKRDDLSNQTVFRFAKNGAVEFHFDQGRVEMTIALVELVHDRRAARDFKIHAYFRPEIEGLDAKLVRDGVLGIEGRLAASDRARLHAVFNQILPEDRPLRLLDLDTSDKRLTGLMITQLLVEEGWLGLAIGPASPQRTAWITPIIQ